MSKQPIPRVATQAETGRACPYCRFPLKEGAQLAVCGVCDAPHHADCWLDNGGCAVFACSGGPEAPSGQPRPAPPRGGAGVAPGGGSLDAAYLPAPSGPVPQPAPADRPTWPQQPPSGWPSWSLAAAVVVLALAIAGAAVAIVLTRQGSGTVHLASNAIATTTVTAAANTAPPPASNSTTTPPTPPVTTAGRPAGDASAGTETMSAGDGQLPAVSGEEMQSEIQQMLLAWHEDVVRGDYHSAWELLSHRKQLQNDREYGYSTWVSNQATLRPYLDPAGLQVDVEHTEPAEGVAQVDVTGMSWDKPGASCTEWSGITWVKYEAGGWKYDPGYSTTPQREKEWKSRFSELLGGQC